MRAPMNCKLVGRWRIVEADIWDRQYLDLCGPASIIIRANGRGEIAFGALQVGLDVEYSRASVGFTWEGFDVVVVDRRSLGVAAERGDRAGESFAYVDLGIVAEESARGVDRRE